MLVETRRQASLISVRTGLKEDTCLDLLLSGWSFVQQNDGQPDQWVSSQGSLSLPKK
ncbi:hypothetical protein CAPNMURICA_48 [Arthrobacter phage CapnMurica]|uniref:Uncharacterized protein n=2 Tax=Gordonvirus captnmurica TaxID=1982153 RepID=A0A386KPZ0_9CAUD|nr:hypothetical protein FDH68_gp48 [Arthrobacter phage CaptnMurica]ALY08648.1 hypothetical protein CAPNMURICA_48 [Arthrobacter phage CaptnMurica]AYD87300.1 hypothetical protein SEA_TENNO_51 [Arthrobacter phage Tenno]